MSECRPSAVRRLTIWPVAHLRESGRFKKSTIVKGTAAGARALWMML
jgi:hypothetical protein